MKVLALMNGFGGYWRLSGLFFLLVVALGLRIHQLDHESLFMDEIQQVSVYPYDFVTLIEKAAIDQQPPLDYWIGHMVYFFSTTDTAVRLPAVLFGVGSVLLLAALIGRHANGVTAFLGGLFLAFLPFHIYFSQDARPYSIAMFLLLLMVFNLDQVLDSRETRLWQYMFLLLSATLFLYSRMLAPLVLVTVLGAILFIWSAVLTLREGFWRDGLQRRMWISLGMLGVALVMWFPVLQRILHYGDRYAPDASSLGWDIFLKGIYRFSLWPLWEAFAAQLEPIVLIAIPLVIIAPAASFLPVFRSQPVFRIIAWLMPAAALLHVFIFRAKTDWPFRPPYPMYLLPLAAFVSAILLYQLWNFLRQSRTRVLLRSVIAGGLSIGFVLTVYAAWDLKSFRKKTDWHGLTTHLEREYGPEHLLVFDSITRYGEWEPNFWGFDRYYQGQSPGTAFRNVPFLDTETLSLETRPVVILFHYRNYLLTKRSRYPIMPIPKGLSVPDLKHLNDDRSLRVRAFTGLTVVETTEPTGCLGRDLLHLVKAILPSLPLDSTRVDFHLAAGNLARLVGDPDSAYHLEQALALTQESMTSRTAAIIAHSKRQPVNGVRWTTNKKC